ncbi:hypothetical protein ACN28E_21185 [Archangium lansingense]|uniref:hypothetical protein n=1 Tax=Archangium lansingense TaxID=2995310 RepID=UPI003B75E4FA
MVAAHPVLFRGLTFDAGSGRPMAASEQRAVLLERTDDNFITALLEELRSDTGRKLAASSVINAGEPATGLMLRQPVHRSFHLAVFEAACDAFGEPRLDPSRIESAGLVVRRIDPQTRKSQGWMKVGGEVRGWVTLNGKPERDQDPDPTRRGAPFPAGHPEINALLKNTLTAPEPYEESVSLLFVAPPHVCAAANRTILYGLVPVASSEQVSNKAPKPVQYEEEDLRALLAPYFQGGGGVNLQGLQGRTYSPRYFEDLLRQEPFATNEQARTQAEQQLDQFATMLRVLVSVFNAFEDKGMLAVLNRVRLDYGQGNWKPLGTELARAADVFVFEKSPNYTFVMPQSWPRLSGSDFSALLKAASAAAASRLSTTKLGNILPRWGRFDQPDASYEVRGFIRVRRDDGCPPLIRWSEPSQPFKIAAWYENGKLPPVQVPLPDVTRNNVKDFLPNVAFQVPSGIFDLISRNKPKDFLEQKAKEGRSGAVDWICGFNIPIITLCAFIVLSIFLALLNIIFWWLPFIKICIPVPRRRPPPA